MNQTFSVKDTKISGKSRLHNRRALWIQFNNCALGSSVIPHKEGGPEISCRDLFWEDIGECAARDMDLKLETSTGRSMLHVLGVCVCCVYTHMDECMCKCVHECS